MLDKYWWPGMKKSVAKYVQECVTCQLSKSTNHPSLGELHTWADANPREIWSIDFRGPMPKTADGNSYLCVAVDMGSRWIVTQPMPAMDAEGTAKFIFDKIVCQFGMFLRLVSDRGTNFMSERFQEFLKLLQIKHLPTVAWSPSTNGLVERMNREFGRRMANFINLYQNDWDKRHPEITLAFNTSKHRAMQCEPYFLMYAGKPRLPSDILLPRQIQEQFAKKNPTLGARIMALESALELARLGKLDIFRQNKHEYDSKHKQMTFAPRDKVYLRRFSTPKGKHAKLSPKWLPG